MRTGARGLEVIKHFESLELKSYVDPVGVRTIGYGHTGPAARADAEISEAEADMLLRADLVVAERDVGRFLDASLSQHEFDALVSFTFNVGGGALARSTLRRKLNAGDRSGAATEFARWNKGRVNGRLQVLNGLTRRRAVEQRLFSFGEVDLSGGTEAPKPAAARLVKKARCTSTAVRETGDYLTDFAALVESWDLRHFRATELLTLGHSHSVPTSAAFGANRRPARAKWENMRDAIIALDQFRRALGAPVHILSAHRSKAYNRLVGGVPGSQHTKFRALDFYAKSLSGPSHWAAALAEIRSSGVFSGAIHVYDTFVHIDCGGVDIGP